MRASSRWETSSTCPLSAANAACRSLACATRSAVPYAPSTTRWPARRRRSLTASTIARIRAMSATAPAASATRPGTSVSLSTDLSALEQRRVRRLVVVGLLLARHRGDGDADLRRRVQRRRAVELELGGRLRALGDRRDGRGEGDRRAA